MRRLVVALASAAALLFAAPGAVAQTACSAVRVEADAGLSPAWSAAVRDLETQLSRLAASDCARVSLAVRPRGDGAAIVATAPDGRVAERAVAKPGMLAPTALGLVASIPGEAPKEVRTEAPRREALLASAVSESAAALPPAPAPASESTPLPAPASPDHVHAYAAPAKPLSVWLGFSLGGRAGQPSAIAMGDLEARADLVIRERWLLIASFRYTPVGATSFFNIDNDQYHEGSIALGAGRRLALGAGTFDLAVAPSLVAMRMEGDFGGDVSQRAVEFRMDGSVRWIVPFSEEWRVTLTADADVAPLDLARPIHDDPRLPALPTWTMGLRVGMTGALL